MMIFSLVDGIGASSESESISSSLAENIPRVGEGLLTCDCSFSFTTSGSFSFDRFSSFLAFFLPSDLDDFVLFDSAEPDLVALSFSFDLPLFLLLLFFSSCSDFSSCLCFRGDRRLSATGGLKLFTLRCFLFGCSASSSDERYSRVRVGREGEAVRLASCCMSLSRNFRPGLRSRMCSARSCSSICIRRPAGEIGGFEECR